MWPRADLVVETEIEGPKRRPLERLSGSWLGFLAVGTLAALLALAIWFHRSRFLEPETRGPFPLAKVDVFGAPWLVCKHYVLRELRPTGTATFPRRFSSHVKVATAVEVPSPGQYAASTAQGWQYRVASHVDHDDPHGARVRSSFVCIVTWGRCRKPTSSPCISDHWTLDDLTTASLALRPE
jgi:hypothetical protein